MQRDKLGSICIILHTYVYFNQDYLLKMLSFFQCIFLTSLSKIGVWVYVWAFNSIDQHICFYANTTLFLLL